MTKTIEPTVDEINKLLTKAFGRGTKGNYTRERPIAFFDIRGYKSVPKLDCIVRKRMSSEPRLIGRFTEQDGSHIVIYDPNKDLRRAEIYSVFYQDKFGVIPMIEIKSSRKQVIH